MSTTTAAIVDNDELEEEEEEEEEDYNPYYYSSNDVFNIQAYNELYRVLNEAVKHWTASLSSSNTTTTDQKDNSFPSNNIKALETMEQQDQQNNNNNSKCIKQAEEEAKKEAAALAVLRSYKASSESTTPTPTTPTPPTTTTGPPSEAAVVVEGVGEQSTSSSLDINNLQTPQTLGEALSMLNKLQTMKDDLLAERDRNNKFVERYQEKVTKAERMATLHQLIPRELFVREDRYQQELEHVYKWSGISDQEIAEIYLTKLKKSGGVKQHGASVTTKKDPYAVFRDVPNFLDPTNNGNKGSNGYSSSSTNDIIRGLAFMRRIGSGAN